MYILPHYGQKKSLGVTASSHFVHITSTSAIGKFDGNIAHGRYTLKDRACAGLMTLAEFIPICESGSQDSHPYIFFLDPQVGGKK